MDKQLKILLVEDQALIALRSQKMLENLGFAVQVCTDGETAIGICSESAAYDLVLMDIDLGDGIDGITAARHILASHDVPVIFVSAHTETEIILKTELVTAYGYIVKDSNPIAYDASIKMALKLFAEKQRTRTIEKILAETIELLNQPLFISDTNGDVIYANRIFQGMQSPNIGAYGYKSFAEFSKEMEVFDARGKLLESSDWASIRGLRGLEGKDEPYYVLRKPEGIILFGHYNFGPIRDSSGTIIGSYVVVTRILPDIAEGMAERIKAQVF
jgi:CheY-like chemotaxis protein